MFTKPQNYYHQYHLHVSCIRQQSGDCYCTQSESTTLPKKNPTINNVCERKTFRLIKFPLCNRTLKPLSQSIYQSTLRSDLHFLSKTGAFVDFVSLASYCWNQDQQTWLWPPVQDKMQVQLKK